MDGYNQVESMRSQLRGYMAPAQPADVVNAVKAFDAKLDSLAGSTAPSSRGRGGANRAPDFVRINGAMGQAITALDNGDMAPTPAMLRGYAAECGKLRTLIVGWQNVTTKDLPALNTVLSRNNVAPVRAASPPLPLPACGSASSTRDRGVAATHPGNAVSHSRAAEEDDGDEDPGSR